MEITKTQWFILLFLIVSFIAVGGVAAFVSASLLAFIPAYFYLKSIRNTEVEGKEPWPAVRTAFIWGALSGVFLAMFLNDLSCSLSLPFRGYYFNDFLRFS